jgi:malonyl-CoA O-methyltransferase
VIVQRIQASAVEGHRKWSATYDRDPNPVLSLEFRIAAGLLGDLHGTRFVDVGSGTGRWLVEAHRRGANVAGLDLCREMLLRAAGKPGSEGRLAQADIKCLPLRDGCADIVMCAFSLGYVSFLDAAMIQLARVTKPGGRVMVTDIHAEGLRRGWTRSFRCGQHVYELENHAHSEEQWREAGRNAGLTLDRWIEARFGDPERAIFRRAGKEELFDAARALPAVLIAVWRR